MPKKINSRKIPKNISIEVRSQGSIRFQVTLAGKRISATFSEEDYQKGLIWAEKQKLQLLEEKNKSKQSATPISLSVNPEKVLLKDIFESFRIYELDKLAGKVTEASRLKHLCDWFGNLTLSQLDEDLIERWKEDRFSGVYGWGRDSARNNAIKKGARLLNKDQRYRLKKQLEKQGKTVVLSNPTPVSTQTVRHEIVLLRRAIKHYFERNKLLSQYGAFMTGMHLFMMDLPEQAKPRTQRISNQNIFQVFENMPSEHIKLTYYFALLTSLRRSEVVSLHWEDLDLNNKVIFLRKASQIKKSKTHDRDVPLLPEAVDVLKKLEIKKTGAIFPFEASELTKIWRKCADKVGLYGIRLHDCRREAISYLVEKYKLGLNEVKLFSGHRDIATLEKHYVSLNPKMIAAELAAKQMQNRFINIVK